ncbi:hypothetical protein [Providencia stuartii]|nr:hypothetical protein [Providencia stuartii]
MTNANFRCSLTADFHLSQFGSSVPEADVSNVLAASMGWGEGQING